LWLPEALPWAAPKASVKFPVGDSSATGRARSDGSGYCTEVLAGVSIHPAGG
jgi:hypothetical protein